VKKSEAEAHFKRYVAIIQTAETHLAAGRILAGFNEARRALEFVPGMVQHESKVRENSLKSIAAIEIVCRIAAVFLAFEAIDEVEELLKKKRTLDRDTDRDMGDVVALGRERMTDAYAILNKLEQAGPVLEADFAINGKRPDRLRADFIGLMIEAEVVQRIEIDEQPAIQLATDMNRPAVAMCPDCGVRVKAPKAKLLEANKCPKCQNGVSFLLVA